MPNFIPHIVKYLCESCFDSSCFSAQNRSRLWPTQKFGCDYSVYRRLRLRNTFTILSLCVYVFFFYLSRTYFSVFVFNFVLFKHRWTFYFASVFFPLSFFSAVDLCVFHFLIFLPYFLFLIFSPLFTLFAPLKVRRKKMKKSLQSINPVACHADAKFSATFSRSICTVYTHRKKSGKID